MRKENASVGMLISGTCGLSFFVVANFTHIFVGSEVFAGCLQVVCNAFVFMTWRRGYKQYAGVKKLVALIGTIVPMVMATITFCNVLWPALQAIR